MEHQAKTFSGVIDHPQGWTLDHVRNERTNLSAKSKGVLCSIGPALVRAISGDCVTLLCSEPISIGATIVVPVSRPAQPPLNISCVVSRCERGGSGGAFVVVNATIQDMSVAAQPLPSLT